MRFGRMDVSHMHEKRNDEKIGEIASMRIMF